MEWTGEPQWALHAFIGYYLVCIAIAWWFYARPRAEVQC
jgi:NNP family nitrate/nitrite transporter-like MFS transporter